MRLLLVRHAEAGPNGLDEHGRALAKAVAAEIAEAVSRSFPVAAVYSDPAAAALDTARVITDALVVDAPLPTPAFAAPALDAGEEALEAFRTEAWAAVDAMQDEHSPDSTLVLVGDEMAVRLLVCRALSIPFADMRRFRLDPGSLTTFDFRLQPQRRTLLAGLNETCHID